MKIKLIYFYLFGKKQYLTSSSKNIVSMVFQIDNFQLGMLKKCDIADTLLI